MSDHEIPQQIRELASNLVIARMEELGLPIELLDQARLEEADLSDIGSERKQGIKELTAHLDAAWLNPIIIQEAAQMLSPDDQKILDADTLSFDGLFNFNTHTTETEFTYRIPGNDERDFGLDCGVVTAQDGSILYGTENGLAFDLPEDLLTVVARLHNNIGQVFQKNLNQWKYPADQAIQN